MGGPGRWQQGKDLTCDYNQLDVRRLQRGRFLEPGRNFDWQWKSGNEIMATVNVCTEKNKIKLSYKQRSNGNEWKDVSYPVWLDWTWCNYGNYRAWFLCPKCDRRVAILYGGSIFACRHCYKLAYPCQRETASDLAARRANKIRRRLGWEEGLFNLPDGKPKGMHWETFERLTYQHNLFGKRSLDGIGQLGLKNKD